MTISEHIDPTTAAQLYIEARTDELAQQTRVLHEHHIRSFVEWCDENGIEVMSEVGMRTLHTYHQDTKQGINRNTLSSRLGIVRLFIQHCERIGAVERGLSESMLIPRRERNGRTDMLKADDATAMLTHLRKFDYASRTHALIALLWHTGVRTGTARALDVSDVESDKNRLRVRHRPESETPLKNGHDAERYVAISSQLTEILTDYIDHNRVSTTDEYDRRPLFSTENGRIGKSTLKRTAYSVTRPCSYGDGCPHNRDPEQCGAAESTGRAYDCPSSLSPHPIRRGAITHHLRKEVPDKVVSDRCNVSPKVLDQHYDRRTESEKMESRRKFLEDI